MDYITIWFDEEEYVVETKESVIRHRTKEQVIEDVRAILKERD